MTDRLRLLGWGAYGVALLLIVIPLADSLLGVMPFRAGNVTWRFGAVGLFSRAIMTPVFGLLIALTTAAVLDHRRFARILGVLSFVGAALMVLGLVFFGLDSLQTRAQVRPEAVTAFDTASVLAIAKYIAGAVVTVLLGLGGWRLGRRGGHGHRSVRPTRKKEKAPLLVGTRDG